MSQTRIAEQPLEDDAAASESETAANHVGRIGRFMTDGAVAIAVALAVVLSVETIMRGSLTEAASFLSDPSRPGWTTVALVALLLFGLDALMRRAYQSVLVIAPLLLLLVWIGQEKRFYLGDPLYPTDFLYARQIVELMPLMVAERPFTAMLIAAGTIAGIALIVFAWRWTSRLARIGIVGRVARLAIALPVIALLSSVVQHNSFEPLRAKLDVSPMVWDQNANYEHNGFLMALLLNLPMANVAAPAGYSEPAILGIPRTAVAPMSPARRPDIIMVMSESFWDPTRLPGVEIEPDPLVFTRTVQSGHVFSPEFGGMTSNVEFEALTGFSNALLPYGSIPYQQYVRSEMPSLPRFFREAGYDTLAMHPFQSWFWNRGPVYEAFGFDRFLSEENIRPLEKRGKLAGDEALMDEIIRQAEAAHKPLFLFAVTLQNHGPYEPDRYPDNAMKVETGAGKETTGAIRTFAQGMADSDASLERLIQWAERRERETIIVYFGDHLPPLGPHYVSTGFMKSNVADRFAPPDEMIVQHETPLVVWSNRKGAVDVGTVSPSFLPVHVLETAGLEHPFYTGFLGRVHEAYDVVDRNLLIADDGRTQSGWKRHVAIDPLLRDYRLIQYDIMFGKRYGKERFFSPSDDMLLAGPSATSQPARSVQPDT